VSLIVVVCRWVVLWSGQQQQVESKARIFKPHLLPCPLPTELDSVYLVIVIDKGINGTDCSAFEA